MPVASTDSLPAAPPDVRDDGPNGLTITVDAPPSSWLVLAEAYAPGWHATVDGAPAPVLRADGGIRAVSLPAGARRVVLRYAPGSVQVGLVLGVLAVLGIIALAWPASFRRPA